VIAVGHCDDICRFVLAVARFTCESFFFRHFIIVHIELKQSSNQIIFAHDCIHDFGFSPTELNQK